ncbi:hypothetical protein [Poseidonibacter sp.]|uniref:hypothetical protein n=1 Tax=Poseidonibacter sp. TaxID=2321188 RepID=UPI003C7812B2
MKVEPLSGASSIGKIKPIENVTSKPSDISFVNVVKNIANFNSIKRSINKIYKKHYEVYISQKGMEFLKLYEEDHYPIINEHVFSYTKNLKFIYKGY